MINNCKKMSYIKQKWVFLVTWTYFFVPVSYVYYALGRISLPDTKYVMHVVFLQACIQ